MPSNAPDFLIFRGDGSEPDPDRIDRLPAPPPWRAFDERARESRGRTYQADPRDVQLVNAALYLRRPLLITGKPGSGKSSLPYAVAHELGLGDVLYWPITSRTTLADGLYSYDAIARLQDANLFRAPDSEGERKQEPPDIGRYIRLGPLGTAFLPSDHDPPRPRVLLIDEIDKCDVDFANDLLSILEEGRFEIPELVRLPDDPAFDEITIFTHGPNRRQAKVERGLVPCNAFPFIVMTSNDEREFPPAFLRRCLRLDMAAPEKERLSQILEQHLAPDEASQAQIQHLIEGFDQLRRSGVELATDQLLNAAYMILNDVELPERGILREALLRSLADS